MKNITLQIIIATLLAPLSAEGLQLFGSKKVLKKIEAVQVVASAQRMNPTKIFQAQRSLQEKI